MASSIDEELLRKQWNREALGEYEGRWIAFRGGVLSSHESLYTLTEEYLEDMANHRSPIFAFVTFEVRA